MIKIDVIPWNSIGELHTNAFYHLNNELNGLWCDNDIRNKFQTHELCIRQSECPTGNGPDCAMHMPFIVECVIHDERQNKTKNRPIIYYFHQQNSITEIIWARVCEFMQERTRNKNWSILFEYMIRVYENVLHTVFHLCTKFINLHFSILFFSCSFLSTKRNQWSGKKS